MNNKPTHEKSPQVSISKTRNAISGVAFSPDGQRYVLGAVGRYINIRRLADDRLIANYRFPKSIRNLPKLDAKSAMPVDWKECHGKQSEEYYQTDCSK